eukprot:3831257-Rhodomonas_salina.1
MFLNKAQGLCLWQHFPRFRKYVPDAANGTLSQFLELSKGTNVIARPVVEQALSGSLSAQKVRRSPKCFSPGPEIEPRSLEILRRGQMGCLGEVEKRVPRSVHTVPSGYPADLNGKEKLAGYLADHSGTRKLPSGYLAELNGGVRVQISELVDKSDADRNSVPPSPRRTR